jgi:hypothetical protein
MSQVTSLSGCQEYMDTFRPHGHIQYVWNGLSCLNCNCMYRPLMWKISWQHCDCTKQLIWRSCRLQTSDICRLRQVMGKDLRDILWERGVWVEGCSVDVRTDFPLDKENENWPNIFKSTAFPFIILSPTNHCNLLSSAPRSTPIYYSQTHDPLQFNILSPTIHSHFLSSAPRSAPIYYPQPHDPL